MSAAAIVDALNYSCYAFNRQRGMSGADLGKLFTVTGAALEARYQQQDDQQRTAA